jgi:choline dehydrogenase
VRARKEVIVAASAFNSPKLLMLSGIGPAEHLKEMGIEVVADRPGVGQNLQDHLEFYMQQHCLQPITLYSKNNWFWKGVIGAQWLFFKKGIGTSNQFEAAAFIRSAPGVKWPDIQYHFLPMAISYDGSSPAKAHGFQAHVGYNMSKSRGQVTLRSPDVAAPPVIQFNYMSEQEDWIKFRHAVRITREIFSQPAFDPYRGPELSPGPRVQSDEQIDAFLREHLEGAYHPCGTCKMGSANDPMAVVDPHCRVIGVEGLRVADSSIFPHVTYGNLNGPSIMTGEKAADHILGRAPLPRSNQEPWINPRWETSDR